MFAQITRDFCHRPLAVIDSRSQNPFFRGLLARLPTDRKILPNAIVGLKIVNIDLARGDVGQEMPTATRRQKRDVLLC